MLDQRPDELRVRQHGKIGTSCFSAEHFHRVLDGAYRGEIRESHSAAVWRDQDNSQRSGPAIDNSAAKQSAVSQFVPDRGAHRIITGQRAQLDIVAQGAQNLGDVSRRSHHVGAHPQRRSRRFIG